MLEVKKGRYILVVYLETDTPIIFPQVQGPMKSTESIENAKRSIKKRIACALSQHSKEAYRRIIKILEYATTFETSFEGAKNSKERKIELYFSFETISELQKFEEGL